MTFVIGLTGSIGMGKSTTAAMFADHGISVWDADRAVTEIYSEGGSAVGPVSKISPNAIVDGAVSKDILRQNIRENPQLLASIESIVHPLVARNRDEFLKNSTSDIVVLDIPLLFENDLHTMVDKVVCVSTSAEKQLARVLARKTMTSKDLEFILSKQMPNNKKIARSDFIVPTDTLEEAKNAVADIVKHIRQDLIHA